MSQGSERVIDDGGGKLCREPAPVDSARVHEAVEGILGKGDSTAVKAHLHEERAMRECRREGDEEDTEDGEATEFVSVRRAQNVADVVTPEEILHFLGQWILRVVGLCYTVHGMSLHWMFFV